MLREFLWNTFEKTGSLDAYMFIKEIDQAGKSGEEQGNANDEASSASESYE